MGSLMTHEIMMRDNGFSHDPLVLFQDDVQEFPQHGGCSGLAGRLVLGRDRWKLVVGWSVERETWFFLPF